MLGCHDFCGWYEWTFHFFRRKWGQDAVARLWAEAIGGESQRHYLKAARQAGLRGLYHTWVKTGQDEACDWTFTLDEARNVLRWDMRRCPSKGFLIAHDRNADEDYCDHCMGWMIPLLDQVGVEVWEHEHNHLGQCWGTMRRKDLPSHPLEVEADIRRDPRWNTGFVDRWEGGRKQPLMPEASAAIDPCHLLVDWFAGCDRFLVVADEPVDDAEACSTMPSIADKRDGVLMTDRAYLRSLPSGGRQVGVLMGHGSENLGQLASKYLATDKDRRPLLLHPYLPGRTALDWTALGLPRPVPILPLLIRTGQYVHLPGNADPDERFLLAALGRALQQKSLTDS